MQKAGVYMLICVGAAIVTLPPVFGILTESLFGANPIKTARERS